MINPHPDILKILLFVLLLIPGRASAQFDFDISSVEASIGDHKRMRSILLARSSIEQANMLLHDTCSKATVDYKNLNVELDKYSRCFDVIDLIYNSGKTIFNVKNTYDDVKEKLKALSKLNQTYIEKCLSKGNISPGDSIIIKTYVAMFSSITGDAEDLLNSFKDLGVYVTNVIPCKTANLMLILDRINGSLNHIRSTIERTYFILWRYITVRTTIWKKVIFQGHTRREICDSALRRWTNARYELFRGAMKKP